MASWSIQPFGHNTPTPQDSQTTVRYHRANRFTNGRPKTESLYPGTRFLKWVMLQITSSRHFNQALESSESVGLSENFKDCSMKNYSKRWRYSDVIVGES